MKAQSFYVYAHYTPDSDIPFYIGKGANTSRKRAWQKDNRNKWWHHIVNKHGYEVKILYDNLTNEDAEQKEKELIEQYGRRDLGTGPLVNLTEGGGGVLNNVIRDETRKKLSEALTAYYARPEVRATLSERRRLALTKNPETIEKCRRAALKRWNKNKQED